MNNTRGGTQEVGARITILTGAFKGKILRDSSEHPWDFWFLVGKEEAFTQGSSS